MPARFSFIQKSLTERGAKLAGLIAQWRRQPFAWGAILAGGITSMPFFCIGATGKSAPDSAFTWLPDRWAVQTRFQLDSCGDDGDGGRLYGVRLQCDLSKRADGDVYVAMMRGDGDFAATSVGAKRHQKSSRIFNRFAARLYVSRLRCRRVCRRDFPRDDTRIFQSLALPGFGFGHSRNAPRAGYAANGKSAKIYADYVCDDADGLAGDFGNPDFCRLFLERRDSL